jgi:NAD(P)-dependent dehydrogenase (short-subunit alcohol dehydrogenase family)
MKELLQNKRILVAGGGSGIGEATCRRVMEAGGRVVVGDLNRENAESVAAAINEEGGQALAVQFDLRDETSLKKFVATAVGEMGGIDGLANVAADLSPAMIEADRDLLDMDPAIWLSAMRANVIGFALASREAIRQFLKQGNGGAIVNVSSEAASCGEDTRPAYSITKAGVNALTRHTALRWGPDGVRCNAVAPGITMSETAEAMMPEDFKQQWLNLTTMKRFGRPPDQAATIAFLLSDHASWVSGQVWHVNGGSHFHD